MHICLQVRTQKGITLQENIAGKVYCCEETPHPTKICVDMITNYNYGKTTANLNSLLKGLQEDNHPFLFCCYERQKKKNKTIII